MLDKEVKNDSINKIVVYTQSQNCVCIFFSSIYIVGYVDPLLIPPYSQLSRDTETLITFTRSFMTSYRINFQT